MPTYFPQIHSNMIMTQLPYSTELAHETIVQDVETGMRWTFPRRANSQLETYPQEPLGKFAVSFSNITDAEVETLLTFFRARRGRWGTFRFLDPSGNLVQYSEDFSDASWDKTNGPVTVGSSTGDPFGGSLATLLTGGSNAFMMSTVGPSDGGMIGIRMTASMWVKSASAGNYLSIGFVDSTLSTHLYTLYSLPQNSWLRIEHSETLWDNDEFRMIVGGASEWSGFQISAYGAQVSPMKGPGAYVKTPGNYGYHSNCRFDTDSFVRTAIGPNQNSLTLPIVEVN